jgi:hypothetical protein
LFADGDCSGVKFILGNLFGQIDSPASLTEAIPASARLKQRFGMAQYSFMIKNSKMSASEEVATLR